MRVIPTLSLLLLGALSIPAGAAETTIPDALVAAGEKPVLTLHAEGAQVYECKIDKDGKLAWTFREPIATLFDGGKTVGRHYAGPNWEHQDGSGVTGRVVGTAIGATEADIPWLKLAATAHKGSGILADITTVQRINTAGGKLEGACETAGQFRSVAYAADYVFLKKE
ncbi:conserved exported protein of unknown function [Bradyrhizobium sp. ORS 285]|uniref:DUF3455 domain-containing protein n=1 Tax=Bradyrhizobium sp. ORS 285 TaxID=115808 RepID=UPI0002408A65|nr:DUF3455 domain-containing protein [Bradyrhizobium sp. ORS 285]CCD89178.1 conserved exported hypothetical protein [Bradyrhizobium sp. ORS 285]SMX59433.1 conserved exported protein of unknown function [Bradyrhizobium sp. ORS 285]